MKGPGIHMVKKRAVLAPVCNVFHLKSLERYWPGILSVSSLNCHGWISHIVTRHCGQGRGILGSPRGFSHHNHENGRVAGLEGG